MPVHTGKKYACQFCGKPGFTHGKGVKEHEVGCKKNPDRTRWFCRICKKELGSRRALKRHMDALHGGAPIDILEEDA